MIKKLKEIFSDYKIKKKFQRIFFSFSALVVFATAYALILPAITVEKDQALEDQILPNEQGEGLDGREEELLEQDLEGDEEVYVQEEESEVVREKLVFESKDQKVEALVEVQTSQLSEEAVLKIQRLKDDLPSPSGNSKIEKESKRSLYALGKEDERFSVFEEKKEQIEEVLEGPIREIYFYDLSFFDSKGAYLPVDDQAQVSLDLGQEKIQLGSDEEIKVLHLDEDKIISLDSQVQKDDSGKLEVVSFQTQGFSVFAVVKIGSWTEARLPENEYSIITPTGAASYQAAKKEGAELIGKYFELTDVLPRSGGLGTERPFQFINHQVRDKYDRFMIESKAGNLYTIQDKESSLYLSMEGGTLAYTSNEYYFKFYKSSKYEGKVRIQAAETPDKKPLILVYNASNNNYEVRNTYEIEEGNFDYSYHQFIKNPKEYRYRIVNNDITALSPGKYSFIIVSDLRPDNDKRSMDSVRINTWFLNSTSLRKNGEYYYLNNDSKFPTSWTFTKRIDGGFNIQDEEGNYARIIKRSDNNWYYVDLVDPTNADSEADEFIFDFLENNYLRSRANNYEFNLDGGGTVWHAWARTNNNRLSLAALDVVEDPTASEVDLVEAIIPDGEYFISTKDSKKTMKSRDRDTGTVVDAINTSKNNDTLSGINRDKGSFRFIRQKNGSYKVAVFNYYSNSNDDKNRYLRLGDKKHGNNDFNRLVLDRLQDRNDIAPREARFLKIMTLKSDPTAFYIFNEYGSLQYFSNINGWASKPGALGQPLRIYKVSDNKLFTHQENAPTEKLVDIGDGAYVIGNNPSIHKDFTNSDDPEHENFQNKQEIKILQADFSQGDAWIHYNEKSTVENEEQHTIEKKEGFTTDLTQWNFIQTDQPGHYYIESGGTYLNLSSGTLVGGKEKIAIYKREGVPDQILFTQGNYRLRFEGNNWTAIANSEALTEADYHYIGKKVTDYLHFELTNPDEGTGNNWLKNVRLMKTILAKDLAGNLGANIPQGFFEELGPIGNLYKNQNQGQTNPYRKLYRMEQKMVSDLAEEDQEDNYKEYGLLGWEITIDGQSYLIDKQAKFTENTDKTGINIASQYIKIDGQPYPTDLSVPYGNKATPFKTKWIELSAPLYFYFNYGKGIMDVERIMSAGDLIGREGIIPKPKIEKLTSPVFAMGRLFYGEELTETKNDSSSVTMNDKIQTKIRVGQAINFPTDLVNLTESQINQIYINKVGKVPAGPTNSVVYEKATYPVTSGLVKERSINWLRESNSILSILKKSLDGGDDVDFQPDKKNIKIENYDVDYLWLDRKPEGIFLQGIVYGKTAELVVEKQFRNLTEDEFNAIRNIHETSYGSNERFHINIMVDNMRDNIGNPNRPYDDVLYTLAANRGGNNGNIVADTPYPQAGDPPKAYGDIERVHTIVDPAARKIQWRVRTFDEEEFILHEKGADLKNQLETDERRNVHVWIEQYDNQQARPEEKKETFEYGSLDMEDIKTKILTTGRHNFVKFNNLYSSGGVVLLTKYDQITKQPIKGIGFELYKLVDGQEPVKVDQEQRETIENGTIAFWDLELGEYILREVLEENSIYKKIEDYPFKLVEKTAGGKSYYSIEGFNRPFDPVIQDEYEVEITPANLLDNDISTNEIDVYNSNKGNVFIVEKNFVDILYPEYREILERTGNDEFKIFVAGNKDGKDYQKELSYANSDLSTYNKKVVWRFGSLDPVDGQGPALSPVLMDDLTIREENFDHVNYPVVKRRAELNNQPQELGQRIYEIDIEKLNSMEDGSNTFKIDNIYTDTFELLIQVRGRDKNYNSFLPIPNMEFQVYGSLDESSHDAQGQDFEGQRLYLLDKPNDEGTITSTFNTNENGQESILNLVFYEGTQYALVQSKNPGDTTTNTGVVYEPIISPFMIELKDLNGVLSPQVVQNSLKEENWSWEYQNGYLIIQVELDRTNYRLPETGGIGNNRIKKLALAMIGLTATSLIYRKREINLKGEKK